MYQRRPRKHPKIINFVLFYAMRVHFRKAPGRPSHLKPKEIIDNLHNIRLRYERLSLSLKRVETKRSYYKLVRGEAPNDSEIHASRLPLKINGRVDWLRKVGQPAQVISMEDFLRTKTLSTEDINKVVKLKS